jgi:endogenous inhibitor of DNA gyrase (YacG/DUF329 family)
MNDKIADLAARRALKQKTKPRKCPICGKPAAEASRPFCSERCRKADLDRWRSEAYRVPVVETDEEESTPKRDDGDGDKG